MTPAEADEMLDLLVHLQGSPVRAVYAECQGPKPMPVVAIGCAVEAEADAVDTWATDTQEAFPVRTQLWWAHGGNEMHDRARAAFRKLLSAWWNGDGRNEKSRLPSGQTTATQRAIEETLRLWVLDGPVVFCAADIDNFGTYNNMKGWPAGDELIGRLGATLLQQATRDCLVIHRSGDEFSLIYSPRTNPGVAVSHVMSIRREVEQEIRSGLDIDPLPGFSMGVAVCHESMKYADLEDLAGKVLKPNGEKRRGRVTVARPDPPPLPESVNPMEYQLVMAMNQLGDEEPFGDPLLDAASRIAASVGAGAGDLDILAERLPVALSPFTDEEESPLPSDVIVAAAHGLCRAALAGLGVAELHHVDVRTSGDALAVFVGAAEVQVIGEPLTEYQSIQIRGGESNLKELDSRRALLITIGDNELRLPSQLFAEVIFVDDRPTIGGGLPDLWEAAIAQLVACVSRHATLDRVFLAGKLELGAQTVERLRLADQWAQTGQAEILARRLGATSSSRIASTGTRIASRVSEVTSGEELIAIMLGDLRVDHTIQPAAQVDPVAEAPRLRRTLSMDNMLPGKEYGCRVSSASEAFPVALDIVRQAEGGPYEDRSGRTFRELIDFRIQLDQPRTDPIPRFYRTDQVLLDAYVSRQFINDDGLFRAQLNANGQIQAVVKHVAKIVATGRLTSRRALLVVPHVPIEGADLSPLGLISVRIIPRPSSPQNVRLDFSFSWRTVEALVGLPYSLYGSIRFAEHLTDLVTAELDITDPTPSMGSLSYIAHSLHMFVDEYADQVARQVVNDDSL